MNDKLKTQATYLIPLLVFIVMVVFLAIGLTLNPRKLPSELIDKPVPEFTLPALLQETSFSTKDMQGKPWLLNIWASWCAECKVEHPLFNQLASQTNIPIIGLNYKDKADDAKRWLQVWGNPYQMVAVDNKGDVGIDLGTYGVPETFVIDEQGIIRFKHVGALTPKIINEKILPWFYPTK